MKKKAIIVDLDGTLCDHSPRNERILALGYKEVQQWQAHHYDEYYKGMEDDEPVAWCRDMVRTYVQKSYMIFFITGRPERYRAKTLRWIHDNVGLVAHQHFALFMRPDGDYNCDTTNKKSVYFEHIRPDYDVEFVLEDRNKVVRMWREIGLTCLHVAEGNF